MVDKHSFDDRLTGIFQRVRVEPFDDTTIVPADYDSSVRDDLYHMEFCCRCGVCTAGCPAVEAYPNEYVGPAAMLATAYRYLDPLDQGNRVMEAVSNGLYRCIMCGKCDENCQQKDIHHVEMLKKLRAAAEKRGLKPSYAE